MLDRLTQRAAMDGSRRISISSRAHASPRAARRAPMRDVIPRRTNKSASTFSTPSSNAASSTRTRGGSYGKSGAGSRPSSRSSTSRERPGMRAASAARGSFARSPAVTRPSRRNHACRSPPARALSPGAASGRAATGQRGHRLGHAAGRGDRRALVRRRVAGQRLRGERSVGDGCARPVTQRGRALDELEGKRLLPADEVRRSCDVEPNGVDRHVVCGEADAMRPWARGAHRELGHATEFLCLDRGAGDQRAIVRPATNAVASVNTSHAGADAIAARQLVDGVEPGSRRDLARGPSFASSGCRAARLLVEN